MKVLLLSLSCFAFLLVGVASFPVPPTTPLAVRSQGVRIASATITTLSASLPKAEKEETAIPPAVEDTTPASYTTPDSVNSNISNNNAPVSTTLALPEWFAPLAWRGVVLFLCTLWASNFAVAKLILGEPGVDSSLYAVTRFAVAALALAPFAVSTIRRTGMDWETCKAAATCGAWVAFGYLGQTIGLLTTTASRSCVICSLHCIFVALVAESMRISRSKNNNNNKNGQQPLLLFNYQRLVPAAVAVAGVAMVELQGAGGAPTMGDAISLAQPIGFGMGYLQLEELMSKRPDLALPVSAIKLAVVAAASLLLFEVTPLFDHHVTTAAAAAAAVSAGTDFMFRLPNVSAILASPVALGGILYTGLVTTALALWIESIAFAKVPAVDASIILTTEPIFAAGVGAVTLGETFGISDYTGAALIIGACVLATLMDNPGDEACVMEEEDEYCEPPRKWPFWGF